MRILFIGTMPQEIHVYLNAIQKYVILRNGTTDVNCLEKVFINREYEIPFELAPRLIVDAGANVGMATLYLSHQYPNAEIVAIEPEPSNFKMLERNCGGLPNVTLIQAALWSRSCSLEIDDSGSEAWAFRVSERVSTSGKTVAVPTITIQEILDRFHADRIDFLKLDIEGAELELFSQGSEQWIDRIGSIAIELHDRLKPGCAQAFYSVLMSKKFHQEIRGENVFVKILGR